MESETEKRRRVLESVIAISMKSLGDPELAHNEYADAQAAADWDDIGGPSGDFTPEEVERLAVTVFGCPETAEKKKGETLMQVFEEDGLLNDGPAAHENG